MIHALKAPTIDKVYASDAIMICGAVTYANDVCNKYGKLLRESLYSKVWVASVLLAHDEKAIVAQTGRVSSEFAQFLGERGFTVALAAKWEKEAHISEHKMEAFQLAL